MRTIFTALAISLFFIISFPILLLLLLLRRFNRKLSSQIAQFIVRNGFRFVMFFAGMRRKIIGVENVPRDRAVLFAANHKSIMDAPLSYIAIPVLTGFISKIQISKIPFLNLWMKCVNCIFLDRDDLRAGMRMILDCIDNIKNGYSMLISPEGTRSHTDEPLPFKDGSLKPAQKTGCPIIPVAITGTDEMFENHFPWIHKQKCILEFGKPIYLSELPPEIQKHPGEYVRSVIVEMLAKHKEML